MKNQSRQGITVGTARRCAAAVFGNGCGWFISLALFLHVVGAAFGATTPAFIQERDNQVTSGNTSRVTLPSSITAGNLIVVYVIWDNTGSASVSDSRGNSYASAVVPILWSNGKYSAQVFYTISLSSGVDTVTATFATQVNSFGIVYAHEYSGIRQTAPIDVTAAATGTSGSLNSGSAITTNDTDLLFAGGVSANVVSGPGAGYAARSQSQGNITEDRVVNAKGSYSATASNSGGAWAIQMVAFKGNGTSDTTPPTVPPNLSVTGTSASTVSLAWTASTDNVGVAGYKTYRGGVQIGTSGVLSFTDTGLMASTTYSYTVSAYDAAGNNSAQTSPVSATTKTPDNQAPTVSVTSPANNQAVAGTTTITANAADNIGVVGVQFQLDNGNLGAEVTASPYSNSWDTSQATNGSHLLSAVARDAAGNKTTSSGVAVTVSNTSLRPYSTTFPLTENPTSEGGNWINGKAVGVDWGDVRTTPGLAFGTNAGGYADPTAILTGNWGPDQVVQATVHSVNQTDGLYEEVELRLHSTISNHSNTGYTAWRMEMLSKQP